MSGEGQPEMFNPFLIDPHELLRMTNPAGADIVDGLNKHFSDGKETMGWIPMSSPGSVCWTEGCGATDAYECSSDGRCAACAKKMAQGTVLPRRAELLKPEKKTSALSFFNPNFKIFSENFLEN